MVEVAAGEFGECPLQTSVLAHDDGRPYALAFIGIDVTEHRLREAHAHRLAMTDPLTGVANRSASSRRCAGIWIPRAAAGAEC